MNDYQLDLGAQYYTTLISFAVGIALCLLYDAFRILRMTRRRSYVAVFVQDVTYCLVAAMATYIMLLVRCNGIVRFYPLAGELCGFLACRFTLSKLIMLISETIIGAANRVAAAVNKAIFAPIRRLFYQLFQKIGVFAKKITDLLKKHLKGRAHLVYNHVKLHRGGKCDESNR